MEGSLIGVEFRSPDGIGTLHILDKTGDTKLIFDSHNPDEVENAERTFNDLRKKGYVAYAVNKKGDKGEVITKFDASAEKIILSPVIAGG